jgi:phosphate transport system substrate-binding protein
MKKLLAVALGLSATLLTAPSFAAVDASLPGYQKVAGVSGSLSSVGSDTLANLATLWAEEFKRAYPNVNIQIQAAGSSTAPPALTEGTSNVGPMSRAMKSKEVEAFEAKYGYKPTQISVAIDALSIYVHKDNPIKGLTLSEADAIFSSTRKCGAPADISTWDQLGMTGPLAGKEIQIYGRNSVSGTYGYFKEHTLCKGDYKSNVNEQPGSASVVQSVATSINAIGYSGIGYKTSGVRAVPLAKKAGEPFVESSEETAVTGKYPLARALYIYINKAPGKALDPMVKEFMTLVLSKEGQQVVEKDGYVALPAAVAAKELAKLN